MNKSNLRNLLIISIGLIALYWLSYSDTRKSASKSSSRSLLLSHIEWSNLGSVELSSDGKSLSIESDKSGNWYLPSKNSYPASLSQIRSFLLKLMDLSSSQSIETNAEGLEKMGLHDSSSSDSKGSVVLKNSSGDVVEKIYFGALRTKKGASDEDLLSLSGQFIRLALKDKSENTAYLIQLPVSISTEIGSWIEKSILKIEQSKIYKIESFKIEDNKESLSYEISRTNLLFLSEVEPEFSFSISPPKDKEISETVVTQVTTAVEDLKADDVYYVNDEKVNDFKPDNLIKFYLTNGLVYKIMTQDIDGAYFAKIELERDSALIEKLKPMFEEERAKELKSEENSEENANEENPNIEDNLAKKDEVSFQEVSEDEVEKERLRLSSWVYVFPDFVGKKFMKDASQFFKEVAEES